MPAIILAGGYGTRMREETDFRPKPMVEIGGRPIIWHIMKHLGTHGISEFIVCVGYKGEMLKEYFLNYRSLNNDFTVDLVSGDTTFYGGHDEMWTVTISDAGNEATTGGRIAAAARYVAGRRFLLTYGDGLSDVDVTGVVRFHESHDLPATVTTVAPLSRFGVLDLDESGQVEHFREKPQLDGRVSAGYFVLEPEILAAVDPARPFEEYPLPALAAERKLMGYRHEGFWQPMDTYRERRILEDLWASGKARWKTW